MLVKKLTVISVLDLLVLYYELVMDSARAVCWDSFESPYCGSGPLYLYTEQYRLTVFHRTWTAVIMCVVGLSYSVYTPCRLLTGWSPSTKT